jgi:8-oxo-dGTP pyrophosphatase MutT (NUDIX family)
MEFRFCPCCAAPLGRRSVAGDGGCVERLACGACDYIHYGNPTPAVGAIVEHEGEIILARNAAWPPGFFALVTGYLESCEDPVAAVKREVKEELGLDVTVVARGTVRLGAEIAEYRRYRPEKLKPWRRATGLAVADWMRSRGLEFEWLERPALATEHDRT